MADAAQRASVELLPELRGDLQVVSAQASTAAGGAVIFDPVRQRYFRIDETTAQLLSHWPSSRTRDELVATARERSGLPLATADVASLEHFLIANELVTAAGTGDWKRLAERAERSRQRWLPWLIHNYLFFKHPLVRPQRMLERLLPYLAFVYTRTFAMTIAAAGLIGLHLAVRQWHAFFATFPVMVSVEGAAAFTCALVTVKSLHELGHGLTAVRYGCRVPTMGVCFMVMVPMLYTDVSDSWRLNSRRERLAIDIAGLAVEIGIACVAIFVWAFLPEGTLKSLAFAMATTSLVLSIALNLNPFMRFDGYYILSDMTGVENLQPRAFALGVWKLRELLFALGEPPPEQLPGRTRAWLIVYAWLTWVYRLIVFTGIAVLVYHIGFKLLGLVLFAIEIVFFIALPIWREMQEWRKMRHQIIARRRGLALAAVASAAAILCFLPLSSAVTIPALLEPRDLAQLYPRRAAVVIGASVRQGQIVAAGDPIATLHSPDIAHEILVTEARRNGVLGKLDRRSSDAIDRADTVVLGEALTTLDTRLAGLRREQAELHMVAPVAGRIVEIDPSLQKGRWMQRRDLVALVAAEGRYVVRGYVSEDHVARLDTSQSARFIPEDLNQPSLPVRLDRVAAVGAAAMDLIELSSHYGGGVPARAQTRPGEGREQLPAAGQFLVSGEVDGDAIEPGRIVRGTLLATGRPESLVARGWRRLLNVLVRESGL